MKTQNTYDRQTAKFISTLCQNIPDDLSGDVMQGWIENPKSLQKTLAQALTSSDEKESETEPSSLRNLGMPLSIPAQPECTVANCFTDQKVFVYRDPDFDNWLPATLPASAEVSVFGRELTEVTTEEKLIKVGKPFTNLKQIENLILRTEKGEKTGLTTNGYASIFFLQVGSSVFTVSAYRYSGGWDVRLRRFRARDEWSVGGRFFSSAT